MMWLHLFLLDGSPQTICMYVIDSLKVGMYYFFVVTHSGVKRAHLGGKEEVF